MQRIETQPAIPPDHSAPYSMTSEADQGPHHVHFELASDYKSLEQIVEVVEAFVSRWTDDEDFIFRVVMLTSEAVTNAIEHGNHLDPEKRAIVDLSMSGDRIELAVQDEGTGFDPESVADPLADENLLDGRGRGLFLMEQMADELHREMEGRRLRLIFYMPE